MKPSMQLTEDIESNELSGCAREQAMRQFQVDKFSEGAVLIARERIRQLLEKPYNAAHDDQHDDGALAAAAAFYALTPGLRADLKYRHLDPKQPDCVHCMIYPFDNGWVSRADFQIDYNDRRGYVSIDTRIKELAAAGALAAAEIDRLLRIIAKAP